MVTIAAFADEISPILEEQLEVLLDEGIHHLELRSMWGINVLDLSDERLRQVKDAFATAGVVVAAIGSPIGKVAIDTSFDAHVHRFERAITVARYFGTHFIRIFSFYPAGSSSAPGTSSDSTTSRAEPAPNRDMVLHHLRELTARARAAGVTLLHENEKGIYGDTAARCVDLLATIDDSHLEAVFDPANFIQCGQQPYPDAYDALEPWVRHVHVKDALADGSVVAAGEGIAQWPALLGRLKDANYQGYLSLEPHLAESGQFSGFSGPQRFRHASTALKSLLQALPWDFD